MTAGQNEPTPYASKFEIDGKFFYQMILDSSGNFKFYDVKHTLYNGPNDGQTGQFQFIGADVKDYEIPFGYHRENNNVGTFIRFFCYKFFSYFSNSFQFSSLLH